VASSDVGLRRYAAVFEAASEGHFQTKLLQDLIAELQPAAVQMRRLDQLISCAEVRYSGMLYGIVQLLFLWDHNVLYRLEVWRRKSGHHVEKWVTALGTIEALAALAALSHAHPEWSMPEIRNPGDSPILKADNLGHPLLRPDVCVENDVVVGPPGKFLFVTGSNMSGKSTLLRSIGVNAVLAQAGGPVYATHMSLPHASVYTSMRTSDSLEQGISQYMAQLSRLKKVVDGARTATENELCPQALFLLDEILQGTNSAERLIAVRRIIERLLEFGAIGAVTSHELTVPDVPELEGTADIVHFRETAERTADGVTLSFDYKLRPGLSTSTNALKLMEMVGLD
jgi:DNA mismatch repair ATPase MutS